MKIAISQPRYLPALNYLQRIIVSDKFVILDDVQHQRRAFEHRNRVRDSFKAHWLTIPINRAKTSRPLIKEMQVLSKEWINNHKMQLKLYYNNAPFFEPEIIDYLYEDLEDKTNFVEITLLQLIRTFSLLDLCDKINLQRSSSIAIKNTGPEKLFKITKFLNGQVYISGPNGRNYLKKSLFNGIKVVFHDFEFPVYRQLGKEFIPWTAWIDCLFNIGLHKTKNILTRKVDLNENWT